MSLYAMSHGYSSPSRLRRRLLATAGALALLAAGLGGLVRAGAAWPQSWDVALRDRLLELGRGQEWLAALGRLLDVVGGGLVATVVAIGAVVVLLVTRHRHEALFLAVCATGGLVINELVKAAVDRPRATDPPPLWTEESASFASGHAMAAVYIYGALALVLWLLAWRHAWARVLVVVLLVLVVLLPLSRLWSGVHYPSDVVAGLLLGAAWVCVAAALTLVGTDEPPEIPWWEQPRSG